PPAAALFPPASAADTATHPRLGANSAAADTTRHRRRRGGHRPPQRRGSARGGVGVDSQARQDSWGETTREPPRVHTGWAHPVPRLHPSSHPPPGSASPAALYTTCSALADHRWIV